MTRTGLDLSLLTTRTLEAVNVQVVETTLPLAEKEGSAANKLIVVTAENYLEISWQRECRGC